MRGIRVSPRRNGFLIFAVLCCSIFVTTGPAPRAQEQVPGPSSSTLEHGGEPQNWMTFYGNYQGWSYSSLDQISRKNVKDLLPAWAFGAGNPPPALNMRGGLESTPLVVDGVLYLEGIQNNIYALDAVTGNLLWKYNYPWPRAGLTVGAGGARGIAIGDGRLYMGTRDNHLVAVDSHTGKEIWNISVEDNAKCQCGINAAPLFIRGKVVTGVSGVSKSRAYVRAFDASTGKLIWNFDVIPSPDQPGGDTWPPNAYKTGSGATWLTGTYDPDSNIIFWGTGDPYPEDPSGRPGTNLYSDSVLALDADTGTLKWYHQEFPHDPYDYDSTMEPVLIEASIGGTKRKLIVHSSKDGFVYVYDRLTGKVLNTFPFMTVTWTKGLDADGKPLNLVDWKEEKSPMLCPGWGQGLAINHPAYSPQTGWWYMTAMEKCSWQNAVSDAASRVLSPKAPPHIAAFDPITGKTQWTFNTTFYNQSSLLLTAGDLVFAGDVKGNAFALDAKTGQQLWSFNTGSIICSLPMTYSVNGRQYVAIAAGGGSIGENNVDLYYKGAQSQIPPLSATLFVFALPANKK